MEIVHKKENNIDVVALEGRLDSNTASKLEKKIIPIISGGCEKMLIDFAGLNYISSAGLRTLLLTAKKMQAVRGKLALCNMQDFIREVFELAGFTAIFEIYDSCHKAKEFLKE